MVTILALGLGFFASAPTLPPDALTEGAKGRPTLVHFVQVDCVCSVRAAPQVERLRAALGERVHYVAVLDTEEVAARQWTKSTGLGFAVVADPTGKKIAARDVKRSLTTILYNAKGQEVQRWRGHSAAHLQATADAAARLLGNAPVTLALSDVPTDLVAGCTFPAR